jgi:hypothetical protein
MGNVEAVVSQLATRTMQFYRGGNFNPNTVNMVEVSVLLSEISESRLDVELFLGFTQLSDDRSALFSEIYEHVRGMLKADWGQSIDWGYLEAVHGSVRDGLHFMCIALTRWVSRRRWYLSALYRYMGDGQEVTKDQYYERYHQFLGPIKDQYLARLYAVADQVREGLKDG